MTLSEKINERVEKLPAPLQAEVLNFVEYMLAKAERGADERERRDWSEFSLSSAIRGMEEEDMPTYTTADVKVEFA